MEMTVSAEEAVLLRQLLERALSTLREEIGKTEKYEWRQSLHRDEEMLKAMMERLAQVSRA